MEFKDSRTKQNLMTAFSGESMARNKYLFYADKAKQEGHPEVAQLFEQMAQNEGVHGRLLFQRLNGIGTSSANLQDAISGEYGEWTKMYPEFAQIAREEGFEEIASLFEGIAKIEQDHEMRFMSALVNLGKSSGSSAAPAQASVPAAPKTVTAQGYRCIFCGAVFEKRPDVCSVCGAIGSFEPTTYQKTV